MRFSEKLKGAMQELNINQVQLSSLTGCSKSAVSMYLNGKCVPTEFKQKGIAVSLGLPSDYFDKTEEEPQKTVTPMDKSGIHKITLTELSDMLGVDTTTAKAIAVRRELPGLYGCKAGGNKFVFIINEAVFCRC